MHCAREQRISRFFIPSSSHLLLPVDETMLIIASDGGGLRDIDAADRVTADDASKGRVECPV